MDIPEMPLTDKVNKDKLLKNKSKRQETFDKTIIVGGADDEANTDSALI
jgi:hypothetical protein